MVTKLWSNRGTEPGYDINSDGNRPSFASPKIIET